MLLHPPSPALRQRLQDLHILTPEYGRQLSSHLPMALAALDALGAGAGRLDQFSATYRATHPLAEQPPAGRALRDWPALLGLFDSLPDLRASLSRVQAEQGHDALLAQALPRLLESPGATAFHGLIRVAHALESGVDAELVEALAYWASRWQPLPEAPPTTLPMVTDPAAWLDTLDDAWRAQPTDSDAPLIAQRMQTLARGPAWRGHAGRLDLGAQPPEALLAALARAAAERYARSRQFTVLHMLTGLRAAAVLHARQPLPAAAWPRLRDAVAAASGVSGLWRSPAADLPPADADVDDWGPLARRACAQDDDHVVKLVHALAWWDARQPDPVWRRAAARALQA